MSAIWLSYAMVETKRAQVFWTLLSDPFFFSSGYAILISNLIEFILVLEWIPPLENRCRHPKFAADETAISIKAIKYFCRNPIFLWLD